MIRYFLLVILFIVSGCSFNKGLQLSWKNAELPNYYRVNITDAVPEKFAIDIDAKQLLQDTEISDQDYQTLKSMVLSPENLPLLAVLDKIDENNISVIMSGAKMDYNTEGKSPEQIAKLDRAKHMEGILQLTASVSNQGDLNSFYLRQRQKNVAIALFDLPNLEVNVGDSWSLPIVLTSLSGGYVSQDSRKVSKAVLKSITHTKDQGDIAEILYVHSEYVEGNLLMKIDDEKSSSAPFSVGATFVAVAEFLIDKGQWKSYKGQLSYKGSGNLSVLNSKILFYLSPEEP